MDIPSQGPVFVEADVHHDVQTNLISVRALNDVIFCPNLSVTKVGRACVFEFTVPNIRNGELGIEFVVFRILHRHFEDAVIHKKSHASAFDVAIIYFQGIFGLGRRLRNGDCSFGSVSFASKRHRNSKFALSFGYTFDGSNATIRGNGEQFRVLAFECKGCIAIKIEALLSFHFGGRTYFDGGRAADV